MIMIIMIIIIIINSHRHHRQNHNHLRTEERNGIFNKTFVCTQKIHKQKYFYFSFHLFYASVIMSILASFVNAY